MNYIYLAAGVANLAATTAIMVLTSSSRGNKAQGKGTKLAETGRYLARPGRVTGVFPNPLRRAEIATPAKHGSQKPLAGTLRMLLWIISVTHY
jgi:hypothetical protein